MKNTILICALSFLSLGLVAQKTSADGDKEIVVNVLDVTDKGEISINDLAALTGIEVNKADANVVSYTFSYMQDKTTLVEKKIKGAEFTEEILEILKNLKIDQKFYLEQIMVDYNGETVTTNPIIIKIKG